MKKKSVPTLPLVSKTVQESVHLQDDVLLIAFIKRQGRPGILFEASQQLLFGLFIHRAIGVLDQGEPCDRQAENKPFLPLLCFLATWPILVDGAASAPQAERALPFTLVKNLYRLVLGEQIPQLEEAGTLSPFVLSGRLRINNAELCEEVQVMPDLVLLAQLWQRQIPPLRNDGPRMGQ